MPLDLEQMKLSGFEPNPGLKWEEIGVFPPEYTDTTVVAIPVAIDDHKLLVIATEKASGSSSVRLFDASTREWSDEGWPNLNQPRDDFACAFCNGKVYAIGGDINGEVTNTIECLDLAGSSRQWATMSYKLITARYNCKAAVIDKQIYILGGTDEEGDYLASVEIMDSMSEQIHAGPDLPHGGYVYSVASVNDTLFVFSYRDVNGVGKGEMHSLSHGHQQTPRWRTSSLPFALKERSYDVLSIGQCVVPSFTCVYDTERATWWSLPEHPFDGCAEWAVVGGTEIVAFSGDEKIYSLRLKLNTQPPVASVPSCLKKAVRAMLYSPDFSDVLFVCPDGTEIPAHRSMLAADNSYFRAYFSGPWTQQHPGGRWETEKSADVIKALLSLLYTGEVPPHMHDSALLELLESAYEFQLNDDLLRICQAACIESLGVGNVKDLLLSAKLRNASFLFDAAFKFVCEHFFDLGSDPQFAVDVIKVDKQLWRDLVQSARSSSSRKRARSDGGGEASNGD